MTILFSPVADQMIKIFEVTISLEKWQIHSDHKYVAEWQGLINEIIS